MSTPAPFQSPAIGSRRGPRSEGETRSAPPELFPFLRKKCSVDGLYRPIVSTPSPFQSPAIGSSPRCLAEGEDRSPAPDCEDLGKRCCRRRRPCRRCRRCPKPRRSGSSLHCPGRTRRLNRPRRPSSGCAGTRRPSTECKRPVCLRPRPRCRAACGCPPYRRRRRSGYAVPARGPTRCSSSGSPLPTSPGGAGTRRERGPEDLVVAARRSAVDEHLNGSNLHVVERPALHGHRPARARDRARRLEVADRRGRVGRGRVVDDEPARRVPLRRVRPSVMTA